MLKTGNLLNVQNVIFSGEEGGGWFVKICLNYSDSNIISRMSNSGQNRNKILLTGDFCNMTKIILEVYSTTVIHAFVHLLYLSAPPSWGGVLARYDKINYSNEERCHRLCKVRITSRIHIGVNTLQACKKIENFESFWKIWRTYVKNNWANTRHICTHLNVFFHAASKYGKDNLNFEILKELRKLSSYEHSTCGCRGLHYPGGWLLLPHPVWQRGLMGTARCLNNTLCWVVCIDFMTCFLLSTQ